MSLLKNAFVLIVCARGAERGTIEILPFYCHVGLFFGSQIR